MASNIPLLRRLAAALALTLLGAAAQAADDIMVKSANFNIAPQSLASALIAFSSQSGVQVATAEAEISKLKSSGVNGTRQVGEALKLLLKGTSLKFGPVGINTIAITGASSTDSGKRTNNTAAANFTLAQAGVATAELAAQDSQGGEQPEQAPNTKGIPEILVQGKRSSNTDIRRTEDDVQPYVVFSAEDIARSMAGNLEEFLMNRLPMNSSPGINTPNSGSLIGNTSNIDLRGMGNDQTLILVNGRRIPGTALGSDFGQSDINGIALAAVERIEILPSTAGGIYGGGATGGVINIVMKSDYSGFELSARYENTFDTDAGRRRIDGSAGFSLEGGRTHVTVTGSHSDASSLLVGDRDFVARGRALLLRNNPASFQSLTQLPLGATANIASANGQPLVLKTGQSLGFLTTYAPVGYAGAASDNGLALVANAGKYNLDLPRGMQGLDRSLSFTPTVTSARLNVTRDFTDRIEGFIDASYVENKSRISNYGNFQTTAPITIPITAATNPFQQPIRVRYAGADFNYGTLLESWPQTRSVTGGVIVRLPHDWMVHGEYGWGRSSNGRSYSLSVVTNDARLAMNDGRLDVLRDVESHPLDYSPYYFTPTPNSFYVIPAETALESMALRAAGPVFDLPGGSVVVAALVERREQESTPSILASYFVPNVPRYNYYPSRGQTTDSAYVETTVPLISTANAMAGVRALDFQASYRRDNTSTRAPLNSTQQSFVLTSLDGVLPTAAYRTSSVEANQYTLGLRYTPVESLAFRASFGAGVLPPSMGQLVPMQAFNAVPPNLTDPKRGDTIVPLLQELTNSGNPSLLPEQSRSWSAGAIFNPAQWPGLRVSLDYTRITKTDEIANLTPQVLLDMEDKFPGRITRAELTAQDLADDYSGGVIQILEAGLVNLAYSELEAYDVQADYLWNTGMGAFTANLIVTYTSHLTQQVLSSEPLTDTVGYSGGVLPWRGNAGLTWERAGWAAGWNMQYFDGYMIYGATASLASRNSAILSQGSDRIPHQMYHDLFVKRRFEDGAAPGILGGLFGNSEIMLGIGNVLDKSPPILATSSTQGGGYSSYGDPRLRRYSLSLTKRFD